MEKKTGTWDHSWLRLMLPSVKSAKWKKSVLFYQKPVVAWFSIAWHFAWNFPWQLRDLVTPHTLRIPPQTWTYDVTGMRCHLLKFSSAYSHAIYLCIHALACTTKFKPNAWLRAFLSIKASPVVLFISCDWWITFLQWFFLQTLISGSIWMVDLMSDWKPIASYSFWLTKRVLLDI